MPGLLEAAVRVLAERGADIVEVELRLLPRDGDRGHGDLDRGGDGVPRHRPAGPAGTTTSRARGASSPPRPDDSAADYVQAQRVRRVAQKALAELYRDVDRVLTPTCSIGAPDRRPTWTTLIGGPRGTAMHTGYWDSVGNPDAEPADGVHRGRAALGMQLAGRPFDEATVLRAGDAYQQHTDWHLRTPEGYGS
ncbi:hypothetical protein ACU686_11380 [Yinghuangia aomiensis]